MSGFNDILVLRRAAEECFKVASGSFNGQTGTVYPHVELLDCLGEVFKTPTIRFAEGYKTFVESLVTKNTALDSWCKLLGVFMANLDGLTVLQARDTFVKMFDQFKTIHPSLATSFDVENETDVGFMLAWLLSWVSSINVGDKHGF